MKPRDVPNAAVTEIATAIADLRAGPSHQEIERAIREGLARAHPHMVRAAVLSNFTEVDDPDIQTSDLRPIGAVPTTGGVICSECGEYGSHRGTCSRSLIRGGIAGGVLDGSYDGPTG